MTTEKIGIAICDDHELVRESLSLYLSEVPGFEVLGTAHNGEVLLELVKSARPDIVLLDVQLVDESGLDILRSVREFNASQAVIMLTTFKSDSVLVDAYESGAAAYLLKSAHLDEMLLTIRNVAKGERPFDSDEVLHAMKRLDETGLNLIKTLDETDRSILRELAKGSSDQHIAAVVFLSVQTVRNRVSRLLKRFGRDNRTQVAVFLAALPEGTI